ncbi:MAG: hypothetical protein F6K28_56985 [Microcoleus sp. SIO2G3]|nr:hypothetical protein [Microcoleus sp. SIO2G3]
MFQKIQHRLLLSYLVVLTSILLSFAIAIRLVFTHILREHSKQNLQELARDAASDMYVVNNQLEVHKEISIKQLNFEVDLLTQQDCPQDQTTAKLDC